MRLTAVVPRPKPFPKVRVDGEPSASHRRILFDEGWTESRVWKRSDLPLGFHSEGPAVIEEDQATTIVPPQGRLRILQHGVIEIEVS